MTPNTRDGVADVIDGLLDLIESLWEDAPPSKEGKAERAALSALHEHLQTALAMWDAHNTAHN